MNNKPQSQPDFGGPNDPPAVGIGSGDAADDGSSWTDAEYRQFVGQQVTQLYKFAALWSEDTSEDGRAAVSQWMKSLVTRLEFAAKFRKDENALGLVREFRARFNFEQ